MHQNFCQLVYFLQLVSVFVRVLGHLLDAVGHDFLADENASSFVSQFDHSPLVQVCFCLVRQVEGDARDRTKLSSLLQIHNANNEIFATRLVEEVFIASPKPRRAFELILGFDWPDHLSKRQISSLSTVAKTIFKFWNH